MDKTTYKTFYVDFGKEHQKRLQECLNKTEGFIGLNLRFRNIGQCIITDGQVRNSDWFASYEDTKGTFGLSLYTKVGGYNFLKVIHKPGEGSLLRVTDERVMRSMLAQESLSTDSRKPLLNLLVDYMATTSHDYEEPVEGKQLPSKIRTAAFAGLSQELFEKIGKAVADPWENIVVRFLHRLPGEMFIAMAGSLREKEREVFHILQCKGVTPRKTMKQYMVHFAPSISPMAKHQEVCRVANLTSLKRDTVETQIEFEKSSLFPVDQQNIDLEGILNTPDLFLKEYDAYY